MAVSTTSAPELTDEQVARILVKPLEAASTFLAAGPRIFDTAGPLKLPKLGAATSPAWFGENQQITPEVDPDFDEVSLMPSTMKSIKTLTRFSNELARQSVIALDAALKERLVKDVADTLDAQFWSSSNGSSSKLPQGILKYAGQSVTAVGALTLDALLDAEDKALGANVDTGRPQVGHALARADQAAQDQDRHRQQRLRAPARCLPRRWLHDLRPPRRRDEPPRRDDRHAEHREHRPGRLLPDRRRPRPRPKRQDPRPDLADR